LFEKSHALREAIFKIFNAFQKTLRAVQQVEKAAGSRRFLHPIGEEIRVELQTLMPKNFLDLYPLGRLVQLPRYLEALRIRLERGKVDPEKDRKKVEQLKPFLEALERMREDIEAEAPEEKRKAIDDYRWMVEEFKVSLFAPELKTAFPISPKRLAVKIKEINSA
jgi:ATP-dependent helicase HrpA